MANRNDHRAAPAGLPERGPGPEVAVGAVVLARAEQLGERGDGVRVLLIRRGKPPSKGSWSLPGGRVHRNERLVDAAAREVLEETGLAVEVHELVEVVEILVGEFHYVVMDYRASPRDARPSPIAGDDADEVRFVRVETLDDFGVTEAVKRVVAKACAALSAGSSR